MSDWQSELLAEIRGLREDMRNALGEMRNTLGEMRKEIREMHAEMTADNAEVKMQINGIARLFNGHIHETGPALIISDEKE